MNRQSGYTLIELIVVICVLGLMLGFTIPRIQEAVTLDPFEKTSRQLAILIRTLKQAAVADQKVIVLHIDASRNRFWESDDTMPEEGLELAQGKANRLPSGISFSKVTVTGEKRPDDGVARIRFYPKGYSDGAVIQLEGERRRRRYFTVEPFLAQVRMTDEG